MRNVYVVLYPDMVEHAGFHISAIFATEKRAERYIERSKENDAIYAYSMFIEEWNVWADLKGDT